MIPTSQQWRDNQKQTLVSESFLEIRLKITNPEAQADAQVSDNGHEFFSNIEDTTDQTEKEPIKYATMEPGLWILDGTYRILGAEDILPEPPASLYDGFIPFGEFEPMTANWETFMSLRYEEA